MALIGSTLRGELSNVKKPNDHIAIETDEVFTTEPTLRNKNPDRLQIP